MPIELIKIILHNLPMSYIEEKDIPSFDLDVPSDPEGGVKVTFIADQSEITGLVERARKRGITPKSNLRRAIYLSQFIEDQLEDGGNFLLEKAPTLPERVLNIPSQVYRIAIR